MEGAGLNIELRELTKSYGPAGAHAPAVDGISLRIGEGERVGIIGRNGAGKSTLLHMIAGLAEPTSGTIDVTGKVTSIMTLGVGLREDLTGRENIYVDGEVHGKARHEVDRFVDRVAEFADIGEFMDMPVRTYSTGMKARLSFSMITTIEPEILIIDEALSAGDARFAVKAEQTIRRLCDLGRIVMIVSHSMGAIRSMCGRCLWIDRGKVLMDGAADAVTTAYTEAVRREDEARLVERFRRQLGRSVGRPDCEIERFEASYTDSDVPGASLQAGKDVTIALDATLAGGIDRVAVQLRIARVDGLVVFDQCRTPNAPVAGRLALRIHLRPLVFGEGIYFLVANLSAGGELLASRSTIIEVYAGKAPVGGKPALFYPVQVQVDHQLADGFGEAQNARL